MVWVFQTREPLVNRQIFFLSLQKNFNFSDITRFAGLAWANNSSRPEILIFISTRMNNTTLPSPIIFMFGSNTKITLYYAFQSNIKSILHTIFIILPYFFGKMFNNSLIDFRKCDKDTCFYKFVYKPIKLFFFSTRDKYWRIWHNYPFNN